MFDQVEITKIDVLPRDDNPYYPQRARITIKAFGQVRVREVPYKVREKEFVLWDLQLKSVFSPSTYYGGIVYRLVKEEDGYFIKEVAVMLRDWRVDELESCEVLGWAPYAITKEVTNEL